MRQEEEPPKGRTTNVSYAYAQIFVGIVLLVLTATGSACRRSENVNAVYRRIDASAPPFTAKEPLQYRATRITTAGPDAAS
mgnify:CR=1 FL=1